MKESDNGEPGEKVIVEDGMEFVHKAPQHIGDKKRAEEVKEKLQVHKFLCYWCEIELQCISSLQYE